MELGGCRREISIPFWLYSHQLRAPTKLAHTLSLRISCRDVHLIWHDLGFGARLGLATCHRAPTTASKPTGWVINSGISPGLSTWPQRRARARRPPRHARPRAPRARVDPPVIVRRFTTVPNTLWSYSLRRRRDCIRGGRARHPTRAVVCMYVREPTRARNSLKTFFFVSRDAGRSYGAPSESEPKRTLY